MGHESEANDKPIEDISQGKTKDQVASVISNIVVETLRISAEMLENNSQSTFAELGMDSAMATMIVNKLNCQLIMGLPLNPCLHATYNGKQMLRAITRDSFWNQRTQMENY